MDLPVIGAHCSLQGCNELDFLPIKCTGCQSLFCRHHVALDAHACSSLAQTTADISATSNFRRERCAFGSCQKPTLESTIIDKSEPEHRVVATCPNCSNAFCASHRHPSDHTCSNIPPSPSPAQKNPEAHDLLAKHFPGTPSSKVSSTSSKASIPPTDQKKLARLRAVELMKMRHHAVPADPKDKITSVPLTQRIHVKVVSTGETVVTDQLFWFRKTVGTGKAIDLIADRLSIRISDNKGHAIAIVEPAYLDKLPAENGAPARLQNSKLLSEQVKDGETLLLTVGDLRS